MTAPSSPRPEHAGRRERHTADSITSDALDQLYDDLTEERRLYQLRTEQVQRLTHERQAAETQRDQHAAAIARVRTWAQAAIDAGDTGPGPELGRVMLRLLNEPEPEQP